MPTSHDTLRYAIANVEARAYHTDMLAERCLTPQKAKALHDEADDLRTVCEAATLYLTQSEATDAN